MTIKSEAISIREGEHIIFKPGVTEELISTKKGTIAVSIHTPYIEDDKVDIENN